MSINATGIAFVGYPVSDLDRAREFYGGLLGLNCTMDHDLGDGKAWIEYDIGNETLAISNAWPPSGESGPGAAFEVEDLEAALDTLREAGVEVSDVMESPGCRFALISDPDGNSITIHKHKTEL